MYTIWPCATGAGSILPACRDLLLRFGLLHLVPPPFPLARDDDATRRDTGQRATPVPKANSITDPLQGGARRRLCVREPFYFSRSISLLILPPFRPLACAIYLQYQPAGQPLTSAAASLTRGYFGLELINDYETRLCCGMCDLI